MALDLSDYLHTSIVREKIPKTPADFPLESRKKVERTSPTRVLQSRFEFWRRNCCGILKTGGKKLSAGDLEIYSPEKISKFMATLFDRF